MTSWKYAIVVPAFMNIAMLLIGFYRTHENKQKKRAGAPHTQINTTRCDSMIDFQIIRNSNSLLCFLCVCVCV